MITGTVEIDLRRPSDAHDHEAAKDLYAVPAGMRVILYVGDRQFPNVGLVARVAQYVPDVHIDVHGSVRAVEAWVEALHSEGYPAAAPYSGGGTW